MSLTDINSFEKVLELLETDDEIIYEVIEKANPSNKYTLKVFKNLLQFDNDLSAVLQALYKANSDKKNSLKLQVFPRIFSDFQCIEKAKNISNYCILYEFVPFSLQNFIKQKGNLLPFFEIYRFYQSFINALAYLQIKGMFHGRLNPNVIGLSYENNVKFMDFDKFYQGIGLFKPENYQDYQEDLRYLAPELLKALKEKKILKFAGIKADIFSMGVIILQLGNEEFRENDSFYQQLEKEIQEKISNFKKKYEKNIDKNMSDMFERFINILQRIMSLEPEDRPSPLELVKKSMRFVNKKYIENFVSILEQNSGFFDFY